MGLLVLMKLIAFGDYNFIINKGLGIFIGAGLGLRALHTTGMAKLSTSVWITLPYFIYLIYDTNSILLIGQVFLTPL